jgi:hypothetical protein
MTVALLVEFADFVKQARRFAAHLFDVIVVAEGGKLFDLHAAGI